MLSEKIYLETEQSDGYIQTYIADKINGYKRGAVLIIPGGGYAEICSEREGEPIALAFMAHGFYAFVLHYSVGGVVFPEQLIQASKAVKYIRDNADQYGMDSDKVFVVGFSAGGHLAACLGTMWDMKDIYKKIDMPIGYNKPTGMILMYPVISYKFHNITFENLLNSKNPSKAELTMCSIEKYVSKQSSPAYIVHTSNDQVVDVRNSLTLANAMAEKGITFELHIYPDAPHGIALGNEITKCGEEKWCNQSIALWVNNAILWIENLSNQLTP